VPQVKLPAAKKFLPTTAFKGKNRLNLQFSLLAWPVACTVLYKAFPSLQGHNGQIRSERVAITKIEISDMILTGNLFNESGYDEGKSAENLAELKGNIIIDHLESLYPGVEICADIAIQMDSGRPRPLEVLVYNENNEKNQKEADDILNQLSQKIAEGTATQSWAVKIA